MKKKPRTGKRSAGSLHGVFCELRAATIQTNDAESALRENRLLDCEKSIRAIRVHLLESLKTLEPHSQNGGTELPPPNNQKV
jgi:hypothetical protein